MICIKFYKVFLQSKIHLYVWVFVLCGMMGWIAEVIFRSMKASELIIPGFMYGCYLPIYGVGSMMMIFLFEDASKRKIKLFGFNFMPICIFIGSIVILSGLEFFTHYMLEKLFGIELWSYSAHKFNVGGRISLKQSVIFGVGGTIFIYGIYPFVKKVLMGLNHCIMKNLACVVAFIFCLDFCFSLKKYL